MKIKKRTLEYWLLVLFIPVEAIKGIVNSVFFQICNDCKVLPLYAGLYSNDAWRFYKY